MKFLVKVNFANIINIINNKELPIYAKGKNSRVWIHVQDHCDALKCVLEKGVSGRVYNIGGNNERSNLEVVRAILDTVEKPHSLISFVEDRLGHDWRYAIDNTRITTELGWSPKYTFEQGLQSTIEWYLNNRLWWHPLL